MHLMTYSGMGPQARDEDLRQPPRFYRSKLGLSCISTKLVLGMMGPSWSSHAAGSKVN